MFTIHKYRIGPPDGLHRVDMPAGATVLSAGADPDGRVCIWALVDTEAPLRPRMIYAATTGGTLPQGVPDRVLLAAERSSFRGTAVAKTGDVVHIFEV